MKKSWYHIASEHDVVFIYANIHKTPLNLQNVMLPYKMENLKWILRFHFSSLKSTESKIPFYKHRRDTEWENVKKKKKINQFLLWTKRVYIFQKMF